MSWARVVGKGHWSYSYEHPIIALIAIYWAKKNIILDIIPNFNHYKYMYCNWYYIIWWQIRYQTNVTIERWNANRTVASMSALICFVFAANWVVKRKCYIYAVLNREAPRGIPCPQKCLGLNACPPPWKLWNICWPVFKCFFPTVILSNCNWNVFPCGLFINNWMQDLSGLHD